MKKSNDVMLYNIALSLFERARLRKEILDSQISPLGFHEIEERIIFKIDNNHERKRNTDKYVLMELILLKRDLDPVDSAYLIQIIKTESKLREDSGEVIQEKTRVPLSLHLMAVTVIESYSSYGNYRGEEMTKDNFTNLLTTCKIKVF